MCWAVEGGLGCWVGTLLPQVCPRSWGPSLTNTCMTGTSWTSSCRPSWVWAMMKKVEGLKSVTLAADTGDQVSVGARGGAVRGWGRAGALTCREGQLGVDLVHKHLPAGLYHEDLEKHMTGLMMASPGQRRAVDLAPHPPGSACSAKLSARTGPFFGDMKTKEIY